MKTKKIIYLTSGLMMLAALLIAAPSLAATMKNSPAGRSLSNRMGRMGSFKNFMPHSKGTAAVKPAAMGKISAINGSILTVAGINNTTYTVDATNAKITEGPGAKTQTLTAADLTVGETISVVGAVSGTNVTASSISVFNNVATPAMRPGASGKISAINGSILTVTGNNNTTYTVDATNAKISKGFGAKGTALTIANLTVGEMIFANGATSGTNVTATAISVMNNARTKTGQPGNFNRAPRVNGKVTAVNGASFTVQMTGRMRATSTSQNITYTVNTTGSTVFTKNGKTAALADLTTGEMVTVAGTIDSTAATVSATAVNIIARPVGAPQPKNNPPKTNPSLVGRFLNLFKKK